MTDRFLSRPAVHLRRLSPKKRGLLAVALVGIMAFGSYLGLAASRSTASLNPVVFGTNMPLFGANEQLLTNTGTQAILEGWRTPTIRMPFRSSLSDSVELQALRTIKAIGATPLVIVHGAVDSNVLADDTHWLSLVAQVFGSSLVYVEYGNEENLAGIDAIAYTNSWNATVPSLKAAHPTYKFVGPVNGQSNPSYIGYFVGHASPEPDAVSWHEYTCTPTGATGRCFTGITNWATHVTDVNNAEIAAVGHTFPFIISEWNLDPYNDPRYNDPSVIGPWTTQALQELSSLVPTGLIGAEQYPVDSHGDTTGFQLIKSNNSLTDQGQAWQSEVRAGRAGRTSTD